MKKMNRRLGYSDAVVEALPRALRGLAAVFDTRAIGFLGPRKRSLNHLRAIEVARRSQGLVSRGRAGAQRQHQGADRDMRSPFRRLLTLGRDERAATAVEFAILVTPLVGLILASLQLSMIFYAGQMLQTATVTVSRELMTGTSQQAHETAPNFQNDVCNEPTAKMLFTPCSNIVVDVQSASSYSTLNTAPITISYDPVTGKPLQGAYSTGNPGDIIILRVLYSWPVIASPLMPGLANQTNGNHMLVATSVFKTEPY
jgi:Flp pilus assembly protein TadG